LDAREKELIDKIEELKKEQRKGDA